NPMAQAAAVNKYGDVSEEDQDKIKARAAATENFGNFFAQNTFIAAAGVLLIQTTFDSLGYEVSNVSIALASVPVALIMLVMVAIYNMIFDKKMAKKYGANVGAASKEKGER
ncbi:MAG: DUF969 family protein, partial [Carnobacterium sp.]